MEREHQFSGDEVAEVNTWLNDQLANKKASKVVGVSSYQGEVINIFDIEGAGLMTIYSDNRVGRRGFMRVYWSEEEITRQLISAGLIKSEVRAANN